MHMYILTVLPQPVTTVELPLKTKVDSTEAGGGGVISSYLGTTRIEHLQPHMLSGPFASPLQNLLKIYRTLYTHKTGDSVTHG